MKFHDWSTLMSAVFTDIRAAEAQLRLLHMGKDHLEQARVLIWSAQARLALVDGWVKQALVEKALVEKERRIQEGQEGQENRDGE